MSVSDINQTKNYDTSASNPAKNAAVANTDRPHVEAVKPEAHHTSYPASQKSGVTKMTAEQPRQPNPKQDTTHQNPNNKTIVHPDQAKEDAKKKQNKA